MNITAQILSQSFRGVNPCLTAADLDRFEISEQQVAGSRVMLVLGFEVAPAGG